MARWEFQTSVVSQNTDIAARFVDAGATSVGVAGSGTCIGTVFANFILAMLGTHLRSSHSSMSFWALSWLGHGDLLFDGHPPHPLHHERLHEVTQPSLLIQLCASPSAEKNKKKLV